MFENDTSGLWADDGDYITKSSTDDEQKAEAFDRRYETSPTAEPQNNNKPGQWALRGRLRSKVAWEAIASLIMAVLSAWGLWEKIGITEDWFKVVTATLFGVFAAFGVFNDPTNKEGF